MLHSSKPISLHLRLQRRTISLNSGLEIYTSLLTRKWEETSDELDEVVVASPAGGLRESEADPLGLGAVVECVGYGTSRRL